MSPISPSPTPSSAPARPSKTLRRSALVGVLASAADFLMIGLMVHVLAIAPAVANVPALSLGLLIQFFGNKRYAFGDTSPASARQASAFIAVEVVAFALNAGFFHILAVGLGVTPLLARALGSAAVYFGFSYRFWQMIFRAPEPDELPLASRMSPNGHLETSARDCGAPQPEPQGL